ncbi:MAG: hypothetical protein LBT51_11145 [Fusobacteriaceae bacterium]|jgi:hypothetical protein|nr:hypothetical protein [Fusobacteriaceae bacterium]
MNKNGFIIVIVVFLITFMMGIFLINYKIINGKSVRLKSKIDGYMEREEMNNIETIIFHEMYSIEDRIKNDIYKEAIEHFIKNKEDIILWEIILPVDNNDYSLGGYKIKSILSQKKEIFSDTSLITPQNSIITVLNKGKGGEFTINLEKLIKSYYSDITNQMTFKISIILEYNIGNTDITLPDIKSINEMVIDGYN